MRGASVGYSRRCLATELPREPDAGARPCDRRFAWRAKRRRKRAQTLEKQLNDPQVLQASLDDPVKQVNEGMIAGLVLGAPEFQRR